MGQQITEILTFWLDEVGPEGWYKQDDALDAEISRRFAGIWREGMRGHLSPWLSSADGALALVILLDQFPRNMFRGTGDAFASDPAARACAQTAIRLGRDRQIAEPGRQFFYLPFMHSEMLTDQERCVRLILMRMPEDGDKNLPHAIKHREVIRRFGRFPSRNAALGRSDTEAERSYRADGGYMS
ncbi:MAG: DUF924 family protein [Pseudomonadota bacterium]